VIPSDPQVLGPGNLSALTVPTAAPQNPESAGELAHSAAAAVSPETQTSEAANPGLALKRAVHE
jgi:hypothetical protein